jgi:hypothetical protein
LQAENLDLAGDDDAAKGGIGKGPAANYLHGHAIALIWTKHDMTGNSRN